MGRICQWRLQRIGVEGWPNAGGLRRKGRGQHGGRIALMDVQRMARFEDRTMRRRTDATVQRRYWMACAIVKIGRYIAMTINPMMVPNTTIMIGSSSEVSVSTA